MKTASGFFPGTGGLKYRKPISKSLEPVTDSNHFFETGGLKYWKPISIGLEPVGGATVHSSWIFFDNLPT